MKHFLYFICDKSCFDFNPVKFGDIFSFLFSHDGKYITAGSENQCVFLWRTHYEPNNLTVRKDRNNYYEAIKGNNLFKKSASFFTLLLLYSWWWKFLFAPCLNSFPHWFFWQCISRLVCLGSLDPASFLFFKLCK